jgi:hypothetical protein
VREVTRNASVCSETEEEVGDDRNSKKMPAAGVRNRRIRQRLKASQVDPLYEDGEDDAADLLVPLA